LVGLGNAASVPLDPSFRIAVHHSTAAHLHGRPLLAFGMDARALHRDQIVALSGPLRRHGLARRTAMAMPRPLIALYTTSLDGPNDRSALFMPIRYRSSAAPGFDAKDDRRTRPFALTRTRALSSCAPSLDVQVTRGRIAWKVAVPRSQVPARVADDIDA